MQLHTLLTSLRPLNGYLCYIKFSITITLINTVRFDEINSLFNFRNLSLMQHTFYPVFQIIAAWTQMLFIFQDDYRVCLKYGIISRDMKIICPVDASGKFTSEVTDFKGQYVKVIYILNMIKCILWLAFLICLPILKACWYMIQYMMQNITKYYQSKYSCTTAYKKLCVNMWTLSKNMLPGYKWVLIFIGSLCNCKIYRFKHFIGFYHCISIMVTGSRQAHH